ncbi:gamma-glutamylcyclotransferase family protein [Kaarinaea lacus]
MANIHYFAYGSNLHPLRLQQRIPSAHLIGTTTLAGYELCFTKRGQDASGKGHIKPTSHQSCVYGAVYQLAEADKANLDNFEGPGYGHSLFELVVNREVYSCFAYTGLATHLDESLLPFHWYKSLILLGGAYHGFPDDYVQNIQQISSIEDPEPHRRQHHERLINSISNYDRKP